jgi:hypothetical protein
MRPRGNLPEPFETLVQRAGSIKNFQETWEIPPTTFRRWVNALSKGKALPRGAEYILQQMNKAANRGNHVKSK